jgi:activator of 2-hydroxyglutaryl-CoA dehydratase
VRTLICGIDLGSRSVKVAFMKNERLVAEYAYDTIDFYRSHGKKVKDMPRKSLLLAMDETLLVYKGQKLFLN